MHAFFQRHNSSTLSCRPIEPLVNKSTKQTHFWKVSEVQNVQKGSKTKAIHNLILHQSTSENFTGFKVLWKHASVFLLLTFVTTVKRNPHLHGTICLTLWCLFVYSFQCWHTVIFKDCLSDDILTWCVPTHCLFAVIHKLLSRAFCFYFSLFITLMHVRSLLLLLLFLLYCSSSPPNKAFAIYTPPCQTLHSQWGKAILWHLRCYLKLNNNN